MHPTRTDLTSKFSLIDDPLLSSLKSRWFSESQREISFREFLPLANEWFQSTKNNQISGWSEFPCHDVTMGCTHYIESLIGKYGWDGFQILKNEYAYYTLMGKHGVAVDDLKPNKPLLITIPHWTWCDIRPEWNDILTIAKERNIDIHIDMAWMLTARDIEIDLSHPCIKSFAMSMSKLKLEWSRVGVRWSRQRSMDSVTIFNEYYKITNTIMTSVGGFFMENIERDHLWNRYKSAHHDLCNQLNISPTKIVHIAKDNDTGESLGIGRFLGIPTPNCVQ